MKKFMVKTVSVVMAIIMCFMTVIPSFAQSAEINRTCPKVFVHGFMSYDVYADVDNTESDELAWPPSEEKITAAVKQAIAPLAVCAIDRDLDKLGTALAPILDELFAASCLDFNGEITNGSGIRFEYPSPEELNADSEITFGYDWRLDPIVIASQLNDFINYILENTGAQQVVIECHSLGGIITTTYLKLYGNSKVKSVVFNSSAVFGETYTGELLNEEIEINTEGLKEFLEFCFLESDYKNTVSLICEIFEDAGLLDFVISFAGKILNGIYDEVILSVMKLFANWPTIWAMIPDEDVQSAKENVFSMYEANGIDYSGLEEKVNAYNSGIRPYKTETLKNTAKTSNLYVISRYGYSAIPLTSSWDAMGDGVIDAKYSSFGATTALYGKTLDVADSAYLSPDKTIDASTCLFPEQTWFIRDMKHQNMADCLDDMVDTLLYSDTQATVETFEKYPQFMVYDFDNDALLEDNGTTPLSFFELLKLVLMEIINAIKSLFA